MLIILNFFDYWLTMFSLHCITVNVMFTLKAPKQRMTNFMSAIFFSKNVSSKLYHIESSKNRGQTVLIALVAGAHSV